MTAQEDFEYFRRHLSALMERHNVSEIMCALIFLDENREVQFAGPCSITSKQFEPRCEHVDQSGKRCKRQGYDGVCLGARHEYYP